jgi:hypothetical protein
MFISWLQKSESLENYVLLARHFGPADKSSNISFGVACEMKDSVVFNVLLSIYNEKIVESPCNTSQDPNKPLEPGNWKLWKRSIFFTAISITN